MITLPCAPEHLALIDVQPEQVGDREIVIGQAPILAGTGISFSFWQDGACIGGLGVAPMPLGSGHAWAMLSRAAGPHMVAITRRAKLILDLVPYRRVQTSTLCSFTAGRRWLAGPLGFTMEAERMRCYDNLGRDHALYARVKPCPVLSPS